MGYAMRNVAAMAARVAAMEATLGSAIASRRISVEAVVHAGYWGFRVPASATRLAITSGLGDGSRPRSSLAELSPWCWLGSAAIVGSQVPREHPGRGFDVSSV